jgi:hypothetical protein
MQYRYCIPTDNARLLTAAEVTFFDECNPNGGVYVLAYRLVFLLHLLQSLLSSSLQSWMPWTQFPLPNSGLKESHLKKQRVRLPDMHKKFSRINNCYALRVENILQRV